MGYFEEALKEQFHLITLGVDHGDFSRIATQHESADIRLKNTREMFYGPLFL